MAMTERMIRRMITEELTALSEAPGEAPSPGRVSPMMSYRRRDVSDVERSFAQLVRDLGAEEFARMLVRAISDDEKSKSLARFMQRG